MKKYCDRCAEGVESRRLGLEKFAGPMNPAVFIAVLLNMYGRSS